jgi:hypothetical protein
VTLSLGRLGRNPDRPLWSVNHDKQTFAVENCRRQRDPSPTRRAGSLLTGSALPHQPNARILGLAKTGPGNEIRFSCGERPKARRVQLAGGWFER